MSMFWSSAGLAGLLVQLFVDVLATPPPTVANAEMASHEPVIHPMSKSGRKTGATARVEAVNVLWETSPALLDCALVNGQKATVLQIRWYENYIDLPVAKSDCLLVLKQRLFIPKFSPVNTYTCQITYRLPDQPVATTTAKLLTLPRNQSLAYQIYPSRETAYSGESLSLLCRTVQGSSPIWMLSSDERVDVVHNHLRTDRFGQLFFTNLTKDDERTYFCCGSVRDKPFNLDKCLHYQLNVSDVPSSPRNLSVGWHDNKMWAKWRKPAHSGGSPILSYRVSVLCQYYIDGQAAKNRVQVFNLSEANFDKSTTNRSEELNFNCYKSKRHVMDQSRSISQIEVKVEAKNSNGYSHQYSTSPWKLDVYPSNYRWVHAWTLPNNSVAIAMSMPSPTTLSSSSSPRWLQLGYTKNSGRKIKYIHMKAVPNSELKSLVIHDPAFAAVKRKEIHVDFTMGKTFEWFHHGEKYPFPSDSKHTELLETVGVLSVEMKTNRQPCQSNAKTLKRWTRKAVGYCSSRVAKHFRLKEYTPIEKCLETKNGLCKEQLLHLSVPVQSAKTSSKMLFEGLLHFARKIDADSRCPVRVSSIALLDAATGQLQKELLHW